MNFFRYWGFQLLQYVNGFRSLTIIIKSKNTWESGFTKYGVKSMQYGKEIFVINVNK